MGGGGGASSFEDLVKPVAIPALFSKVLMDNLLMELDRTLDAIYSRPPI